MNCSDVLNESILWSPCPFPPDSDSEYSLSGFETVASHSFDEDEEDDEDSAVLSIPYSSPTNMLPEDHHGDEDKAQLNGITKHRSVAHHLQNVLLTPVLLSAAHQKIRILNKGPVSTIRLVVFQFYSRCDMS